MINAIVYGIGLWTNGKLNTYLAEIEKEANNMFFRLVKKMTEKQGVTEQLKETEQMILIEKWTLYAIPLLRL